MIAKNQKSVQEVKKLFKSLGIDVRGLIDYKTLWKTNPNTFAYKGSSSWAYTYSPVMGTIEVRTAYYTVTDKIEKYNEEMSKKYWTGRYHEAEEDFNSMSVHEKKSWIDIKEIYNIKSHE